MGQSKENKIRQVKTHTNYRHSRYLKTKQIWFPQKYLPMLLHYQTIVKLLFWTTS